MPQCDGTQSYLCSDLGHRLLTGRSWQTCCASFPDGLTVHSGDLEQSLSSHPCTHAACTRAYGLKQRCVDMQLVEHLHVDRMACFTCVCFWLTHCMSFIYQYAKCVLNVALYTSGSGYKDMWDCTDISDRRYLRWRSEANSDAMSYVGMFNGLRCDAVVCVCVCHILNNLSTLPWRLIPVSNTWSMQWLGMHLVVRCCKAANP